MVTSANYVLITYTPYNSFHQRKANFKIVRSLTYEKIVNEITKIVILDDGTQMYIALDALSDEASNHIRLEAAERAAAHHAKRNLAIEKEHLEEDRRILASRLEKEKAEYERLKKKFEGKP